MGRLGTFILGFILGGAAVYMSLHYHVVRASDGFHLVPKLSSTFAQAYVDIRGFGFEEWDEHRELAIALARADRSDLIHGVAIDSLQDAVNGMFDSIRSQ